MSFTKNFILIFSIAVFTVSCSNDDDATIINPPPPPQVSDSNSNYFLSDSTNFWIYKTYQVDTNNVETLKNTDTVTVRTENINGENYIVYNMERFLSNNGNKNDLFVRDSMGYIIERYSSQVKFSATDLNTIIAVDSTVPNLYITQYSMVQDSVPLILPVGTFNNVLTFQGKVRAVNGATPFYPEIRYSKQSYVKDVGLAYERFFFFSTNGIYFERRLVEYQVKL